MQEHNINSEEEIFATFVANLQRRLNANSNSIRLERDDFNLIAKINDKAQIINLFKKYKKTSLLLPSRTKDKPYEIGIDDDHVLKQSGCHMFDRIATPLGMASLMGYEIIEGELLFHVDGESGVSYWNGLKSKTDWEMDHQWQKRTISTFLQKHQADILNENLKTISGNMRLNHINIFLDETISNLLLQKESLIESARTLTAK